MPLSFHSHDQKHAALCQASSPGISKPLQAAWILQPFRRITEGIWRSILCLFGFRYRHTLLTHVSSFFSKDIKLKKKKKETPPKKYCIPHIWNTGSHCFSTANKIWEIKIQWKSIISSLEIYQKSGRNDYSWKLDPKVRNSSDPRLVISTAYTWHWSNSLEKFEWQFPFSQAQRHRHFIHSCFCLTRYWGTQLHRSFCIILLSAYPKNQVKTIL